MSLRKAPCEVFLIVAFPQTVMDEESAITSLDGCVENKGGDFEWGAPDDEVFAFINDLERPVATYLYGRRMYETMVFWETAATGPGQSAAELDFAEIWRRADKIVYSRTLKTLSSERTRIERRFDPAQIRELKASSVGDVTVSGAELAGEAMAAGLVDEIHLLVTPVIVGGGKQALPEDVRIRLELLDKHRYLITETAGWARACRDGALAELRGVRRLPEGRLRTRPSGRGRLRVGAPESRPAVPGRAPAQLQPQVLPALAPAYTASNAGVTSRSPGLPTCTPSRC